MGKNEGFGMKMWQRIREWKWRLCYWWRGSSLGDENASAIYKWVSSQIESPFLRRPFHHDEGIMCLWNEMKFSRKMTSFVSSAVGTSAVHFGKVWKLHYCVDNGQIRSVFYFEIFFILFISFLSCFSTP